MSGKLGLPSFSVVLLLDDVPSEKIEACISGQKDVIIVRANENISLPVNVNFLSEVPLEELPVLNEKTDSEFIILCNKLDKENKTINTYFLFNSIVDHIKGLKA